MSKIHSVKGRYLVGGGWKSHALKQNGRASRTASHRARIYFAYPPIEGWPGGDPKLNGYRAGARK
jgi:hypothetical protein